LRAFLRDIVLIFVAAIVISFLLQIVIEKSVINGCCMEPGLQDEQLFLINKVAYHFYEPERGDIIIFRPPNNQKSSHFIKRIIALPGDIVEVKKRAVYVNGSKLDEPYIKELPKYVLARRKIPENNYFVLGDNRNNANDSHNGWTVPRQNIIGKAWLSVWPPARWGLIAHYPLQEQLAISISE